MILSKKAFFIIPVFFFVSACLIAQEDGSKSQGTIKVSKAKDKTVYIKAVVSYDDLNRQNYFQPFPIVEGYPFPFNYNKYFNARFKREKPDIRGKSNDTVKINFNISAKGKANFESKTKKTDNILNKQCLDFLKEIKEWQPGYIITAEKGIFKNQTVIKPNKKNVSSAGAITILFSTEPFEY